MQREPVARGDAEGEVLQREVEEYGLVLEVVELLAGDLGAGLEVDEVERLGDREVVARGEALGREVAGVPTRRSSRWSSSVRPRGVSAWVRLGTRAQASSRARRAASV
ncbi:hypothetical protein [Nannocystis pusilla]|uniref:hypothetical protein n=1 Tax=Nannocystis pusilla TaxID=889268 RepID=UPI003B7C6FD9